MIELVSVEGLERAHSFKVSETSWLWTGRANDHGVQVIVSDPDIVVYVRPIATPGSGCIGVALVDQNGVELIHQVTWTGPSVGSDRGDDARSDNDIDVWLLKQIAKDEATANEVSGEHDLWMGEHRDLSVLDIEDVYDTLEITRRRVLAECEAKRRIVALHKIESRPEKTLVTDGHGHATDVVETGRLEYSCATCDDNDEDAPSWRLEASCPTLRASALPYADRPGYREEWAV